MRRAAVVGVGDELLSGLVVNSNAAMIGELLATVGIEVVRSVAVGDDEDDIVDVLRQACSLAEVVVVTGGLGPTQDDRTREALARLLDVPLDRHEDIVDDLRQRFAAFGREMPASNAKQADVPRGADVVPNPYGTAPGLRAAFASSVIYVVPGVPSEARRMLTETIVPALAEGVGAIRSRHVRCVGLAESDIAMRFEDLATATNPRMAFLPGGGEIRLRFVATGADADACEARLDVAEATVRERLGEVVYGTGEDSLEAVVGRELRDRGWTLATAESCTAGLLCARVANIPGSSDYLRGGVVTYATEAKTAELGVPAALLAEHGAVHPDVARAMAAGARERFGVDVALSVTGVAGPAPQDGRPPGTLILGLAAPDGAEVRELRVPGDRDQVRLFATTFALNLLRLHLQRPR